MADGVRAGLLDTEDDVVDHLTLGAVLAQVVAQALAGAQQVRGLGRDAEVQARWRRPRLHAALRQLTPRMTTTEGGDAVHSTAAMQAVSTVAAFDATEMRGRRRRAHPFGGGARREVFFRSILKAVAPAAARGRAATTRQGADRDAEDQSLPVVRRQGRGGGGLLRLPLSRTRGSSTRRATSRDLRARRDRS